MNRSTKIALIVLVTVGLIGGLLIVTGFAVDRNAPNAEVAAADDERMGLLDRLLAPVRGDFDLTRLTGCDRTGSQIRVATSCEMLVMGAKGTPSVFYLLRRSGIVLGCYGFDERSYRECREGSGDEGPRALEPRTRFTIGADQARLWLSCQGTGGCLVTVASQ